MPRRTAAANRSAVLDAARDAFARDGYDGATIRGIGERSGVDPAMVIRYFGSKEALFAQAVDLQLGLPALEPGLAADELAELVAFGIERWERDPTLVALLRAAVVNEAVAERLRTVFAEQVVTMLRDAQVDRPEERAGLLTSIVFGLVMTRHVIRIPPMSTLSAEKLQRQVVPVVTACLRG